MQQLQAGEIKEEEDFNVEEMLEGIADEDLDEESRLARRKAQERRRQAQEYQRKTQTLADVLKKSAENIFDYILERNMREADDYIRMEDAEMRRQTMILQRVQAIEGVMGEDSEFSLEEVKIRAFNKPKEKIEFWEEIKNPKNEGILVNFGND